LEFFIFCLFWHLVKINGYFKVGGMFRPIINYIIFILLVLYFFFGCNSLGKLYVPDRGNLFIILLYLPILIAPGLTRLPWYAVPFVALPTNKNIWNGERAVARNFGDRKHQLR